MLLCMICKVKKYNITDDFIKKFTVFQKNKIIFLMLNTIILAFYIKFNDVLVQRQKYGAPCEN